MKKLFQEIRRGLVALDWSTPCNKVTNTFLAGCALASLTFLLWVATIIPAAALQYQIIGLDAAKPSVEMILVFLPWQVLVGAGYALAHTTVMRAIQWVVAQFCAEPAG